MARIKTTLSIEEALIRRVRVRAARTGQRDSAVLEEALRQGLGLIERIRAKAGLSDEDAVSLAHEVLGEGPPSPESRSNLR
jgi:plasmid stability protein